MKVTVWAWSQAAGFNAVAVKLLRSLGFRVAMKPLGADYFAAVHDSRNRAQIGFYGWQSDFPASGQFLAHLFSCAAFRRGDIQSLNVSEFCDRALDRRMRRAQELQLADPGASRALWGRIDREVTDQAPWVPLFTPKQVDLLSTRAGNYQYSSSGMGMLIDQLWVR